MFGITDRILPLAAYLSIVCASGACVLDEHYCPWEEMTAPQPDVGFQPRGVYGVNAVATVDARWHGSCGEPNECSESCNYQSFRVEMESQDCSLKEVRDCDYRECWTSGESISGFRAEVQISRNTPGRCEPTIRLIHAEDGRAEEFKVGPIEFARANQVHTECTVYSRRGEQPCGPVVALTNELVHVNFRTDFLVDGLQLVEKPTILWEGAESVMEADSTHYEGALGCRDLGGTTECWILVDKQGRLRLQLDAGVMAEYQIQFVE